MSKRSLKQMLLNACEQERGLAVELAEIAGYSSGSSFMKVLKDEKKEFAKFYGLLKVVRHQFPNKEKELMTDYALTLDPNKQTARVMLEYFNINNMMEERKLMINSLLSSKNSISKEWASVHEIDYCYLNKEIDFNEAIKRLSSLTLKCDEMKIVAEIFKSYCYLDEHEYNMIKRSMDTISNNFDSIKDDFIKEILFCRYSILLVGYFVRTQKKMKVRDICWSLIDQVDDEYFKCFAYLHLGNSYILEDYQKSYNFLMNGYSIAKDKFERVSFALRNSINFVSNLWKKDTVLLNLHSKEVSDIHEVSFYYIQHGQNEMARRTLNQLDFKELTVNQKAFHCYYRGLLDKSMKKFSESVIYFKKSNDFFFRQLPILELSKMNIPECVVEALAE
jgi:hypothetical protein